MRTRAPYTECRLYYDGWGRARCGKIIPAEFLKEGCTFEPDYERIYDQGNVE